MQLFNCTSCQKPVYFENAVCFSCGSELGFRSNHMDMIALSLQENGSLRYNKGGVLGKSYKFCNNKQHLVCNWLISNNDEDIYCTACQLNSIIPDISKPEYYERWAKLEEAKHRLVYSLLKMGLPVVSKKINPVKGISFEFKSDSANPNGQRVLTGHANGVITMNIAEADDVEREMARNEMDEVYRTVLGHFRHEIAHYYWEVMVQPFPEVLKSFREVFGDESIDYGEALKKHYEEGIPDDWHLEYISSYASTHPWEDWAETWAHYMHIIDTLETAGAFGVSINTKVGDEDIMDAKITYNAYNISDFRRIYNLWIPLTFMMNNLNRSMGLNDTYPFVINDKVYKKLEYIHKLVQENKKTGFVNDYLLS